eukprot:GDKI01049824.1.p1 GENE.GDKI01049824.1~~GDKI01049824.1.p1  ORF type:complete len:324 (+),score=115.17 GDKI01049824.1:47-1018(+)
MAETAEKKPAGEVQMGEDENPLFSDALPAEMIQNIRDDKEDEADEKIGEACAFKDRGNDAFKKGKAGYDDAIRYYTRGLEVQCADRKLNSVLFSNRAAVRLNMQQYTEAVDDCRKALGLDDKNIKAFYRASKASAALELWKNCIAYAMGGLRLEPDHSELGALLKQAEAKLLSKQKSASSSSSSGGGSKEEEQIDPVPFNAEEAEELQLSLVDLENQVRVADAEIAHLEREQLRQDLVKKELNTLGESHNVMRQFGRTFIQQPRAAVLEHVEGKLNACAADIPKLKNKRNTVDKRRAEQEKRLKGMLLHLQMQKAIEQQGGKR